MTKTRDEAIEDGGDIQHLLMLVRNRDEAAARKLVEQYEPQIRLLARLRLRDRNLRCLLDSMDICQSVWKNFFRSVEQGEFALETVEQLTNLLARMVRNKVIDKHRRTAQGGGRDRARSVGEEALAGVPCRDASPTEVMVGREAQGRFDELIPTLEPVDRELVRLRMNRHSYKEIAELLGGTYEVATLRVRWQRAVRQLGALMGEGT